MTTMNISLPIELKNFIDRKVENERYGTSSEYIRHLLREEEKISARLELSGELMLGLNDSFVSLDDKFFVKELAHIKKASREKISK